ncbi:MAG: winged helix-turn-helix transcriptional regulator [Bacteroidetes bacterium]|nr:MAG: winged helix-turn-helix transcriptional regulator [Bacteroidota bacterium]
MDKNLEIDNVDLKILQILMTDATLAYTEVAKRVFVSDATVHVRMKKLKEMGIVLGSQLTLDYSKLGWDIKAFVGIYLDRSSLYDDVVAELGKIVEIVELNYTTGSYSMFAKLICRDTQHLRAVLHDKLQPIRGIQRTETLISLEESVSRNIQLS